MNWKEQNYSREQFLRKSPADLYLEWLEARKQPRIVHFAGYQKPWNVPSCDMALSFWNYARKTPYYEAIIMKNNGFDEQKISRLKRASGKKTLLQGGIQCVADHGIVYTYKLMLKKIQNRFHL